MDNSLHLVHTTAENIKVYVSQGKKSEFDFVVRYLQPGKRLRTPKHIHIMIDLYVKRLMKEQLTNELLDYIIDEIISKVSPSHTMPPSLVMFSVNEMTRFQPLSSYGEYSIEFILVVVELLMLQEKTNYPNGTLNLSGFQKFRNGHDIFSVVNAATFRGAS